MHTINVGVGIRFKNPIAFRQPWDQLYRDHLTYAARVDALGFDGIWVAEHHCTPQGYDPAPLIALTAIAGVTKHCKLGTQPLLLPLRNPVIAAEEAAAVDMFSGGRLILGVGVGYLESDFEAIGIPRKERGARTDESIDILSKALWEEEPFDYNGKFYKVKGVALAPRPIQKQMRIDVVIRSEAAAKRVARPGVHVNLNSLAVARSLGPKVAEIASTAGRDPSTVGLSLLASGFLADSEEKARALATPYNLEDSKQYLNYWSSSNDAVDREMSAMASAVQTSGQPQGAYSPQALVDTIHTYIETMAATGLKPDWVNLTLWPAGMPIEQALDCLERVARDVLPKDSAEPRAEQITTRTGAFTFLRNIGLAMASNYIPAKSGAYRWFVVFVMGLVFAIMTIDRQVMQVLQVPIQNDLHLSDTELGLLTGLAYALFYGTMALPLARIAERVNRVGMVAICMAVWSAMTALSGIATSFFTLFLSRMGVGFGEAGCYPVSASLIADYFEKHRRPFALALYAIGLSVGGMAGPAFAGTLAYYYGWREAFMFLGAGGIVLAPLVFLFVKDPKRGAMDEDSAATLRIKPPSFFRCLQVYWRTPSYFYLVLAGGVHALVQGGAQGWVAPYLSRRFHISIAELGLLIGLLLGGGGLLGNLTSGYLVGRLGRTDPRWYAVVPAIASAIIIPAVIFEFCVPSLTLAIVCGVVAVFCMLVFAPPTVALTQTLLVPQMRTTAASITLMMTSLMSAFGPLVVGLGSDRLMHHGFDNVESLRYSAIGLVLLEAVAMILFLKCAANLPADFARDRSGDAGVPDPVAH